MALLQFCDIRLLAQKKGGLFVFYDAFIRLCNKKGITPYKFSQDTGVGQSTISMWKKKGTFPSADKLPKIADYFGVTVDYLLTSEDKTLSLEAMKHQRKRMGQSAQKMADLLHIPKETYIAYEEGVEVPPQNVIDFLTYFFGVTEDYLFGRTSYPYDPNTNLVEKTVLRLDEQGQKKEAPAVLDAAEALRQYFIKKLGREPTDEELDKLADFAEIYIKGLDK